MNCAYTKYEPIFGSWYITRELGQGSEGHLYEIRKQDTLGHVSYSAMKAITIPGDEKAQKEILARGIRQEDLEAYYRDAVNANVREYRLMYQLKGNSHIVSYEDHQVIRHEDDAGWDILIRIEELTPLTDHVMESPLSPREVARLGLDICKGLVYCQQSDIIHRDIKPDNIFISNSGDYKLGDFGIAQIMEYTHTVYSKKGTYTFMAPEVYRGDGYGLTVDIYSLGLVMYKYLNDGRSPFLPAFPELFNNEDEELALARRISGKEVPPPAHGSRRLKNIVLKACRYHAEDRYQNAQEMLDDLQDLIHDEDWEEEPGSSDGRSSLSRLGAEVRAQRRRDKTSVDTGRGSGSSAKPARRRRILAVLLAAVCVCAAAVILIRQMIPREITKIEGLGPGTRIYLGEELKPDYTIEPDRFSDEKIIFSSSDDQIFTVDEDGTIHAVSIGDAVLNMKAGDHTQSAQITVIPKVTAIAGIPDTISLTAGKSKSLKPTLSPDKFASEPVTYAVDDTSVATVNKEGKIRAVAKGRTNLTVSAGGCVVKSVIRVKKKVQKKKEEQPQQTAPADTPSGGGSTYSPGSSNAGSSGSSAGSSGNSGGGSGEYFDSSADEYFY